MVVPRDPLVNTIDVTGVTRTILEEFRRVSLAGGLSEAHRRNIVSHHDSSIRFTNSSISVLKPALGTEQRLFVVQPAVRLRNLDYYREHGSISGFGCSFTAFGALFPTGGLVEAASLASTFIDDLMRRLGVSGQKTTCELVMRGSPADSDLLEASRIAGWKVEEDSTRPAAFLHRFGIPGVAGRNTNMAVDVGFGLVEVGNIIVVEADGRPIGVDLAFGATMLIVATSGVSHPVLVSPVAQAAPHLKTNLMLLDAIGTTATLALDGMRPSARGRSGRYRQLLRIALELHPGTDADVSADLVAAVAAEGDIRRSTSSLHPDDAERTVDAACEAVSDHVQAVATATRRPAEGPAG